MCNIYLFISMYTMSGRVKIILLLKIYHVVIYFKILFLQYNTKSKNISLKVKK